MGHRSQRTRIATLGHGFSGGSDLLLSLGGAHGFVSSIPIEPGNLGGQKNTRSIVKQHQNDSVSRNFSEALRRARGDRSQAEFARLLGIPSQQTYQRYEGGLVPGGGVLLRIANKLGVTVDELLQGGKQPRPAPKELGESGYIPWGFEMEEMVQESIGFTALARATSSKGLFWAITQILNNPKASDRAKMYWAKALGEWAIAKADLEEKGLDHGEHSKLVDQDADCSKQYVDFVNPSISVADVNAAKNLNLWDALSAKLKSRVESERGMQAWLAEKLEVTPQAVNRWISGDAAPNANLTLRLKSWIDRGGTKAQEP